MIRTMMDTTTAEMGKLRGLPVALAAAIGTVVAAAVLAAAIAGSGTATSPGQVVVQGIPFIQVGPILIGVLTVGAEYTGSNMRTSLIATPNRLLLLAGKSTAYLITASITSAIALGAGLLTAKVALALHNMPQEATSAWLTIGAGAYLVLIGLLGLALALLLRSLIPPLVSMLSLAVIVSPLLSTVTSYARYLPDRAGSLLYRPGVGTDLTPGTGTLVLLAWIAAITAVAVTEFRNRDA